MLKKSGMERERGRKRAPKSNRTLFSTHLPHNSIWFRVNGMATFASKTVAHKRFLYNAKNTCECVCGCMEALYSNTLIGSTGTSNEKIWKSVYWLWMKKIDLFNAEMTPLSVLGPAILPQTHAHVHKYTHSCILLPVKRGNKPTLKNVPTTKLHSFIYTYERYQYICAYVAH